MDHTPTMRVIETRRDSNENAGSLLQCQGATGYPLGKRAAAHKAHNQVWLPMLLARVVDWHDRFMLEGGDRLGLSLETSSELSIVDEWPRQQLQGDITLETWVTRMQDRGHSASGDLFDNLVSAESSEYHGGTGPGDGGVRGVLLRIS